MIGNGTHALEQAVNDLLSKEDAGRQFALHVLPDATRTDEPWVFIVVGQGRPGIRAYEFAELLARVEQLVREQQHKKEVLLLPALG